MPRSKPFAMSSRDAWLLYKLCVPLPYPMYRPYPTLPYVPYPALCTLPYPALHYPTLPSTVGKEATRRGVHGSAWGGQASVGPSAWPGNMPTTVMMMMMMMMMQGTLSSWLMRVFGELGANLTTRLGINLTDQCKTAASAWSKRFCKFDSCVYG